MRDVARNEPSLTVGLLPRCRFALLSLRIHANHRQLQPKVFVAHTEAEYLQLVSLVDDLVDKMGEDESHPLASLMEIVGALIENYEREHVPELTAE